MSYISQIKSLDTRLDQVYSSVPASYDDGDVVTICSVTGGPVWIKSLVEYMDTAMSNATTTTITACGIVCDAGAVLIDAGAIGSVVPSPLSAFAKVPSALASISPNVAAVTGNAGGFGLVAGLGNIVVTFATTMDDDDRYSIHIIYLKLSPYSLIS